mgnify:CR=1 FL=1
MPGCDADGNGEVSFDEAHAQALIAAETIDIPLKASDMLLRQFSRSVRVMSQAAQSPVGHVDSAVMLHAKLKTGMRLLDILPLTRSLGNKVTDNPETYVWRDASGASVRVELQGGRCTRWELQRDTSN